MGRKFSHRVKRFSFGFALILAVTGCAQTTVFTRGEGPLSSKSGDRVLLMPADIELYEMTAGGLLEPKADWTAAAFANVTESIKQELQAKNDILVVYKPPTDDLGKTQDHQQIIKLHEAVGGIISTNQMNALLQLPTKQDKFDWTLGQGVNILREEYDADYALFVFLRDSYASEGRIAFIIVAVPASAVTGVNFVPSGGSQVGFASLVDLRSGDIVWFNRLFSEAGDLRTPEPAREAIQNLLDKIPL